MKKGKIGYIYFFNKSMKWSVAMVAWPHNTTFFPKK